REAVGGVPRRLLVPDVDDADLLVDTAVVDGLNVPAAQREDVRNPLPAQRACDQATTMNEGHPANIAGSADRRETPATVWGVRLSVNRADQPGEGRNQDFFGGSPAFGEAAPAVERRLDRKAVVAEDHHQRAGLKALEVRGDALCDLVPDGFEAARRVQGA